MQSSSVPPSERQVQRATLAAAPAAVLRSMSGPTGGYADARRLAGPSASMPVLPPPRRATLSEQHDRPDGQMRQVSSPVVARHPDPAARDPRAALGCDSRAEGMTLQTEERGPRRTLAEMIGEVLVLVSARLAPQRRGRSDGRGRRTRHRRGGASLRRHRRGRAGIQSARRAPS